MLNDRFPLFDYQMEIQYRRGSADPDVIAIPQSSITLLASDTIVHVRGLGVDIKIPISQVSEIAFKKLAVPV
jgi:hypothetical protein